MKTSALALLALIGTATAGRPNLSINVSNGNFAGLDGLDPTISWEGSTTSGDMDITYGVDAAARATTDIASLPRSVWGKASQTVGDWRASVRADVDAGDMSSADLTIDANNEDADLSVQVLASAGNDFTVSNVEATMGFDVDGARVTVNPRYNVGTEEGDVVIGYANGDTNVEVTASAEAQSVTISQQLDDENRVAPTLSSGGAISLEWERSLGDGNSLTTTLKPNESVDVEWKDSAWTANINMPIDGTEIGGANVSIKREVSF